MQIHRDSSTLGKRLTVSSVLSLVAHLCLWLDVEAFLLFHPHGCIQTSTLQQLLMSEQSRIRRRRQEEMGWRGTSDQNVQKRHNKRPESVSEAQKCFLQRSVCHSLYHTNMHKTNVAEKDFHFMVFSQQQAQLNANVGFDAMFLFVTLMLWEIKRVKTKIWGGRNSSERRQGRGWVTHNAFWHQRCF